MEEIALMALPRNVEEDSEEGSLSTDHASIEQGSQNLLFKAQIEKDEVELRHDAMDSLTAFSLACRVIQVVELSMEMLSKSREILKNGSLDENKEIDSMINHLTNLRAGLNLPTTPSSRENTQQFFDDEKTLKDLAMKCSETSHELITELHSFRIQNPHSKQPSWPKLKWKKGIIEDIQKKLDRYQKILDTRILVNLRSVRSSPVTL